MDKELKTPYLLSAEQVRKMRAPQRAAHIWVATKRAEKGLQAAPGTPGPGPVDALSLRYTGHGMEFSRTQWHPLPAPITCVISADHRGSPLLSVRSPPFLFFSLLFGPSLLTSSCVFLSMFVAFPSPIPHIIPLPCFPQPLPLHISNTCSTISYGFKYY